ncbi:hypothetical protein Nepgr_017687 [Nepenthes gracilis]|uniref:E2 ubiquitin-conjugating enzyme n=1 Tax=Nepenthes gracilis TaxID=150966 RepID=A0AAD3ST39_NEPGR|nr:hypothetical protein Nepgr_017687 [Nepenthes gracilis]
MASNVFQFAGFHGKTNLVTVDVLIPSSSRPLFVTRVFTVRGKSPLATLFYHSRISSLQAKEFSFIEINFSTRSREVLISWSTQKTSCLKLEQSRIFEAAQQPKSRRILPMDMFGDTDMLSFSETSSDDQDDISSFSGKAQSILSSLDDSIGKIDDLLSFEREFMPGDIVCVAGDPLGQMGRVESINLFVDIENVFGKIIKNVSANNLARMCLFSVGDYVIRGPWLGRVDKVVDRVGILLDDGTKCEVMATGQEKIMAISTNFLDDSIYPYHPGQRVKIGLSSVPKSTGWLCGVSKKNHDEGTVLSVEAGFVYVEWLASALVGLNMSVAPPPSLQNPKSLTLLSCFPHANWHLSDWCILRSASTMDNQDTFYTSNLVKEDKKLERGSSRRDFNSKLEDMFVIIKKKTKLDVMWQDGSLVLGLDSHFLVPASIVNAHDFFPHQFVMEKTGCEDPKGSTGQRWGFVRSMDANERTVEVKWKVVDVDGGDSNEEWLEETVSAYEIIEHPDLFYNLGDIVFTLEKNRFVDQLGVLSMRDMDAIGINEESANDADETRKRCFLSCIGHVIGFKDGKVEVQWASGVTNKVGPDKILHVERDDDSIATHALHEENTTGLDHETTEEGTESLHLKQKDVLDINVTGENHEDNHGNSKLFGIPRAAIGFFTNIAASFFGFGWLTTTGMPRTADGGKIESLHGQEVLSSCNISTANLLSGVDESDQYEETCLKDEVNDVNIPSLMMHSKISDLVKQFDIVGDCSDHHFVNGVGKADAQLQVRPSWLKKVQREWSNLEQNLPGMIYVHIYEERMDLLRAAIVGAPGTPYHDGLFFFDVFLPPDYPNEPPLMHYHSGGLRLNPNLYESGKICLSLLNTWSGTGSEVWNPRSSNILQVLLSLQALVLNERPYFNEAGYDKQMGRAEGEKNSMSYNENAFLITCKSMLYLLRKPPKDFKMLVEEHFRSRSQHILSACKAYMEGAPIGFALAEERDKTGHERGSSTGFKIMLSKLFPKLAEAFANNGTDCSQ